MCSLQGLRPASHKVSGSVAAAAFKTVTRGYASGKVKVS